MPAPEPNPHVAENNAREEGRQSALVKRCTHGCRPGRVSPDCEKHGFQKLGSLTKPIWDGPKETRVAPQATAPIIEHLSERYAELKRLCWNLLESACKNYPEKSRTYWHDEEHRAIAEHIEFK
jgi:hypothetical protein